MDRFHAADLVPGPVRWLAAVVVGAVLLSACSRGGEPEAREPATEISWPGALSADAIVLYRPATNRLVTYNTVTQRIESPGATGQVFQAEFPGRQDLYTSGSSSDGGYELLGVEERAIRRIASLGTRQGLFPLASDGDVVLLVVQDYDEADRPAASHVVRLTDGRLDPLPRLDDQRISGGALIDGTLHYTTYDPATDRYTLRRATDPTGASPTIAVERTGLERGALGVVDHQLVVGGQVGGQAFDCSYYCFFAPDRPIAVTIAPTDGGDLRLTVADPTRHRELGAVSGDLIGFRVTATTVDVYGTDLYERVPLT